MNVIILNGSPRTNGSSSKMVKVFANEAKLLGHKVTVKNIGKLNIKGCKACDACRKGKTELCVQDDDMTKILPALEKCEVLIIASPIYYFSFSGQMHCAIERCYTFQKLPNLKKAGMLLSAGSSGFEGAIQTYQDAILGYMGAKNIGIIKSVGDIKDSTLERVKKLAHKI